MARRREPDWEELARELSARVAAFAPDWTDPNDSDPGVTLVELFGFLTESILARPERSPRARTRLMDALSRLDRVDADRCPDGTLTRVRYVAGQDLSAADFQQEQDYQRAKQRRHNVLLHGTGIVRGLNVTVRTGAPAQGPVVVVSPGVAIAPDGEELLVCEPLTTEVGAGRIASFVTLRLEDLETGTTVGGEASRIEESATIAVLDDVPPGHLAIARLRRDGEKWQPDRGFRPARAGR